ncbi:MAG: SEC-C metal-binding domain-containing protein [Oscillospiraceae bacterium]
MFSPKAKTLAQGGIHSRRASKIKRGPQAACRLGNRNDPCPCGSGKKYKNCCGR